MTDVRIGDLLRKKKVIVCCGAGGVGKTTTAAAISIAAARAGRKVLVLTIDPSRRLAETLGVSRNPTDPVRIPKERSDAAGITTGTLDAWMLDIKLVSDGAVRRLVKSEADAQRILTNRIYQQVSTMVAGMHEYTAMEALHRLVHEGRYDLVVLDTPPSRNALDFLEAPRRLSGLVDSRAISAFLPKSDSMVARAASRVIEKILSAVFGEDLGNQRLVGFGGSGADREADFAEAQFEQPVAERPQTIRPVVVGSYASDKDIVIDQGLHAGDRVIVDNFVRLVPNAQVKPVPAGQAPEKK